MPSTPSPLRYPGGKAKLYSLIEPIIARNISGNNKAYVEPFAGGAGLALELLFNNVVDFLLLNDIDYSIYCFWHSCLNHTETLCKMINDCCVDINTWKLQKQIYLSNEPYTALEIGFATFFLNRCNVSGVIQGGPIGGIEQLGTYPLNARFNKTNLINKIKRIGDNSQRIAFYNLDATSFMNDIVVNYDVASTILNIDPPYVRKGKMLYHNSFQESNHAELSNVIKALRYKWIVTYDECDLIYTLYDGFRIQNISLDYSAGKTRKGSELLILSDIIDI